MLESDGGTEVLMGWVVDGDGVGKNGQKFCGGLSIERGRGTGGAGSSLARGHFFTRRTR